MPVPIMLLLLVSIGALLPSALRAATFTVTDCGDTTPGGGLGQLRRLMNDAAAGDTITIPACTITLTGAAGELNNASGDLNIVRNLVIRGAGAGLTIVDGGGIDRVFHVAGSVTAEISDMTMRNGAVLACTFVGGGGSSPGGAGICNAATLTLNRVVVSGHPGEGVLNQFGTLTVADSSIRDNHGDGITNRNGLVTVTSSTLSGNDLGSGISNQSGTVRLTNVTVSGNRPLGGVRNVDATVEIRNSTILGNQANMTGGGILNFSGSVILRNTIVANSVAGGDCGGYVPVTSLGHNLGSDSSCPFTGTGDRVNTEPRLGLLADNDGPTQTHAPLLGSPAIDAGDNTGCPDTDQRGITRPQNGICDIGAVEVELAGLPASLAISPPSGTYVASQAFDLVLIVDAPVRTIVGGVATFDGLDILLPLAGCVRPGTLAGGGLSLRCPGLQGSLLGPGTHTLSVLLNFSDGSNAAAAVTWIVRAGTEP